MRRPIYVGDQVTSVVGDKVVIRTKNNEVKEYKLWKYERSNQSTCIDQRPIVRKSQLVKKGDVIGVAQSGLPRFHIADLERQTALMAMAQKDARMLLNDDPELSSERGKAARVLLWLMEQDKAIRLISVG